MWVNSEGGTESKTGKYCLYFTEIRGCWWKSVQHFLFLHIQCFAASVSVSSSPGSTSASKFIRFHFHFSLGLLLLSSIFIVNIKGQKSFLEFWGLQPHIWFYLILGRPSLWSALAEIFTGSFWAALGWSQAVFGLSTRWDLIFDLIKMRQRSIFHHTLDCLRPAYTSSVISTYPLYTGLKMGIFTKIEVELHIHNRRI